MVNYLKKHRVIGLLLLLFAFGAILRIYHFSDWMHFELDQSRDAKIIDLAIDQGIGNLPLLGPKAAGSFLRLGPIFYYFNYVSALIFGNTPDGIATFGLIFSCLSIPAFYLLARRFFAEKISLFVTTLFAVSFFLVMYSRFSWNPNNLPFFVLLGMFSLLKAVDSDETRKGWWLIASAISLSVATQLHFVAFLALPTITVIFLLIKRPKIRLIFWCGSLLAIFILYLPVIINDIKTEGGSIKEFTAVFAKKSSDDDHGLVEKIARSSEETIVGYALVLSGYSEMELPRITTPGKIGLQIICTDECKNKLPLGLLSAGILIAGVLLFFQSFYSQKDTRRRDFLFLVGIWFIVSLILFVPIAFDLAPRFLLLVAPLPFIFFAFIFDFLEKKRLSILAYILLFLIVGLNMWGIGGRFQELSSAASKSSKPMPDRILKEKYRVTLAQQLMITEYIAKIQKKNDFPVYINSEPFYRRSFLYHLDQRNILRDDFRNVQTIYQNGNYFLIYPTLSNLDKKIDKYLTSYNILDKKEFGTLMVFQLTPKPEAITAIEQTFGPEKKPTSAPGVPVRCRWNEILEECNQDGLEADDEIEI